MLTETSIKRIFDTYYHQQKNYPRADAFNYKKDDQWHSISTDEFIRLAALISTNLMKLGVQVQQKIGLISGSRYEWHLIDFAVSQIGAVLVPLYPNMIAKDYEYVMKEAEIEILFVSTNTILKNVKSIVHHLEKPCTIYTIDKVEGEQHYATLLQNEPNWIALRNRMKYISENSLATIIYTSGTEGRPKGVMLSHKNIVGNILATQNAFKLSVQDRGLSFLPLNHVYEKTVSYIFIYVGLPIFYAESMLKVVDNAKEIKPTIFACIPLLIKKIYERINEKGRELKGFKKIIFDWSIRIANDWDNEKRFRPWYELQRWILDTLVYSKWREALGGKVRIIASGSAAINPSMIKVFQCAKIYLCEGYGLTETSPIVAVNRPNDYDMKLGTVGPLLEGVKLRINPDGEILLKGDCIMMGYYKNEALTKTVLNDGWLATGDIGTFVKHKFLKITDRKKEIFKTMDGKYVAPQLVEGKLRETPLIENCMIFGENKEVVAALIQPNWELLRKWTAQNGIDEITNADNATIILHPRVKQLYAECVTNANKNLSSHEQVRRFTLVPDTWSIDTEELTPTLKVKRKNIAAKYDGLMKEVFESYPPPKKKK